MSSITRSQAFLTAVAALVALPATSALIATHDIHSTRQQLSSKSSLLTLDASQQPFSELDKLRAKRLSLLRRAEPEPATEAAVEKNDMDGAAHGSFTMGLEYLYDAGQERHSDDLFHIILMPSTFRSDFMSTEHVAKSCSDILGIAPEKAHELSRFVKHQGFSCLGTWTREECLSLGEELASRELDCRVIPFSEGLVPDSLPVPDEFSDITVNTAVAANSITPSRNSAVLSCSP